MRRNALRETIRELLAEAGGQYPYTSLLGRLGKEKARGVNFHRLQDDRNNYRAGLSNDYITPSAKMFEEIHRPPEQGGYGINTVVTLNADHGGNEIGRYVKAAGLEHIYVPTGEKQPLSPESWARVQEALERGNTLVHCTHGADRTGAIVGRYYISSLGWDPVASLRHAEEFGGPKKEFPKTRLWLLTGQTSFED